MHSAVLHFNAFSVFNLNAKLMIGFEKYGFKNSFFNVRPSITLIMKYCTNLFLFVQPLDPFTLSASKSTKPKLGEFCFDLGPLINVAKVVERMVTQNIFDDILQGRFHKVYNCWIEFPFYFS